MSTQTYATINRHDDPIRFQETELISREEMIKNGGKYIKGSFYFCGPDNDMKLPADYSWWFLKNVNYYDEVKRDVNPDIPINRSLHDAGCEVQGFTLDNASDDPDMIERLHVDSCTVTTDYLGRKVLARISEKSETKVTWQHDITMWHSKLPEVPMDLLHRFVKALKELGWGRTETRHLLYGYLRVNQEHTACRMQSKGLKHQRFTINKIHTPVSSVWVMGFTDPDMEMDDITIRMQGIIDASEICNYGDLLEREREALEQSNFEAQMISADHAYYDNNGTFKQVAWTEAYNEENNQDDLEEPLWFEVKDDNIDQVNDAQTHTIVPFKHVNDDLPHWVIDDIMTCSWTKIKKLQGKLIEKDKNWEFNAQFSPSQIGQLWDWINERRVASGKAPLKSKRHLYEIRKVGKRRRWCLKDTKSVYKRNVDRSGFEQVRANGQLRWRSKTQPNMYKKAA